jgi:hypothetical protein
VESEVPLRVGLIGRHSARGKKKKELVRGLQQLGGSWWRVLNRTDTRGSMRKFVAVQEMDGAILARLHHIQWCWQLRMGVQQEVIGGRWWLGNSSLEYARGPGVGPLQLSNAH